MRERERKKKKDQNLSGSMYAGTKKRDRERARKRQTEGVCQHPSTHSCHVRLVKAKRPFARKS